MIEYEKAVDFSENEFEKRFTLSSSAQNDIYVKYTKRFFDFILAFVTFILASPVMLITMIVIKLESAGPAIYKQERLGLNGHAFVIYKFRSMKIDAEKDGPAWAAKEDNRTTKIGRFLRKYHVDELPQLMNVLRGNMSFVGPRPEREYFYIKFERTLPYFRTRLAVKPGLTGWAQINGGYDITPKEKLHYDREYIRSISFFYDFKILLKTIGVVLKGTGAR